MVQSIDMTVSPHSTPVCPPRQFRHPHLHHQHPHYHHYQHHRHYHDQGEMQVIRMNSSVSEGALDRTGGDGGRLPAEGTPLGGPAKCCRTLSSRRANDGIPKNGGGGGGKGVGMSNGRSGKQIARTTENENGGPSPVIRLLVLGGHGVGKSAITVRYLTRRFIGEYKSQVDIIYRQSTLIDGIKFDLEIIDISSRPGDDTLPTLEICQCDCYLVVYSVAERHTFLTANHLLRAIFKLRPQLPTPPITLLGNKQDLEHSRQVSREEGENTSRVFGCDFAEVSVAETSEDIVPVFTSLLRRSRRHNCLCNHSNRALQDLTQAWNRPGPTVSLTKSSVLKTSCTSPCYCSCQHTFLIDSQTCRHCGCSDIKLNKISSLSKNENSALRYFSNETTRSLPRSINGPQRVTVMRQASERTNRKVSRSNSKKHTPQSPNTPLQKRVNSGTPSVTFDQVIRKPSSNPPQQSPSEVRDNKVAATVNKDSTRIRDTLKIPSFIPGHAALSRSLSSPEAWPTTHSNLKPTRSLTLENTPSSSSELSRSKTHKESRVNEFFASLTSQDPSLSLLSRGRSFVLDTSKSKRNFECSCGTQNRTGSFKSSGKVEIVTIKNPKVNVGSGETTKSLNPMISCSLGPEKPNLPKIGKKLKTGPIGSSSQNLNDEMDRSSASSLPTTSKSLRSSKKLLPTLEPLDTTTSHLVTDSRGSPTSVARQRKFSVFGRALGNFLSKGSLPDLPRATANICDKFGSLKKTIKKRSV